MITSPLSADDCIILNPAARPTQKCDLGAYTTIDPLFLKAQENGIEFVTITQAGEAATLNGKSRAKTVNFEWDWGFRFGVGINLAHDGWDLFANWMRFKTDADRSVRARSDEMLLPVVAHPGTTNDFGGAVANTSSSDWDLHLNEVDLALGRQFFVSKWLALKPHAGFRTAWIEQTDHVKFNGLSGVNFADGIVDLSSKYWGLGLRAGLDTQWGIDCGLSLIADFSAALLYGYFSTTHNETGIFANGSNVALFSFNDFYHIGRVITDFLIGLRYDYLFYDDRYHVGIQAGWEHHMFFGQNQFIRFTDANAQASFFADQGDLTLHGFSARVRFDF